MGVFYHTIGLREGLHIGGVRGRETTPWYVVGKDVPRNILYVDQGADSPFLYSRWLRATTPSWVAGAPPARKLECSAKVRYRQRDVPCQLRVLDNEDAIEVTFPEPQRAVTSGQSVVLYQDDEIGRAHV